VFVTVTIKVNVSIPAEISVSEYLGGRFYIPQIYAYRTSDVRILPAKNRIF
jgi:hypothetical protein